MPKLEHLNGTIFYAYQVCPREAWFCYHRISPSQEHELLFLGRIVHEESYQRAKKEIFVDRLLKIDFLRGGMVAEVKKSSRHTDAARLQLAYYLYYLKHEKGLDLEGRLMFPKERKTEKVLLTPELEKEVEKLISRISELVARDVPPPVKRIRYCKSCSFYEFCFSDDEHNTD